jgi:hypothetical protein
MGAIEDKLSKAVDVIEDCLEKRNVQLLGALLSGVLPLILLTFFSIDSFHSSLTNQYVWLSFLDEYEVQIIVVCVVLNALPTVVNPLISLLSTKSKSFAGLDGLTALIHSLKSIVDAKYKRFELVRNNLSSQPGAPSNSIFSEITKPDQQIAIIVETIHLFIKEVAKQRVKGIQDSQIKVRLIKVESNDLNNYFHCAPENCQPYTPIAKLKNPDSTAFRCLENKRMILISDIEKELIKTERRYFPTHKDSTDEYDVDKGSLICYPILLNNEVQFVLCVSSNIPYFFKDHLKNVYKFVLDQFALRMKLEISLLKLKELA